MDQALSLFVRDLYRASTDIEIGNFQDWAMEKLKSLIHFDSGMWADAIFDGENPPNVHHFYLYGDNFYRNTNEIIEHYQNIHEKGLAIDEVAITLTQNIGTTVCWRDIQGSDSMAWDHPIYEHFARFYKQEHICSTSIDNYDTEFLSFISLYREDRDRPFSEEDKHIKSIVASHLSESYRINLQFQALGNDKNNEQKAVGLVDKYGAIFYRTPNFQTAIEEIYGRCFENIRITNSALIDQVVKEVDGVIQGIKITSKKTLTGHFLVVIHTDPLLRVLTPRQREILILVQQGKTYKEIAFTLGKSYHAIDTQLREIRRKLKVKRLSMIPRLEAKKH